MNDDDLYKNYLNASQIQLNKDYLNACSVGDLKRVKFLLTSKRISRHAYIHYHYDTGLICACAYGHFETVKYLLSSPELTKHANIHAQSDAALRMACNNNKLEVVKYLLSSLDLKEHANIHASADDAFRKIYNNARKCTSKEYDILHYLIVDFEIERTPIINRFMIENPNLEVQEMFDKRELKESLQKDLAHNKIINKKIKL
jgi:hypothetical protein